MKLLILSLFLLFPFSLLSKGAPDHCDRTATDSILEEIPSIRKQGVSDRSYSSRLTLSKRALERTRIDSLDTLDKEPNKWVAGILAFFLGHFGVHRLYLGTSTKVPVIYTLTLGGGIILPFVDAFHLLFSKDISAYRHNPRILMWMKEGSEQNGEDTDDPP